MYMNALFKNTFLIYILFCVPEFWGSYKNLKVKMCHNWEPALQEADLYQLSEHPELL